MASVPPPTNTKGACRITHINPKLGRWLLGKMMLEIMGYPGRVREKNGAYRRIVCLHYIELEGLQRVLGKSALPSLQQAGSKDEVYPILKTHNFTSAGRLADELDRLWPRGLRLPTLEEAHNIACETEWITRACLNRRTYGFLAKQGAHIVPYSLSSHVCGNLGIVLIERK